MPTRNINLTDHFASFLARTVESGRYKNTSEAVRAALHLLERQELEDEARLVALRRDSHRGEEAYRRGEYTVVDGDEDLDRFFETVAAEADRA